jgi:hypothetical protein
MLPSHGDRQGYASFGAVGQRGVGVNTAWPSPSSTALTIGSIHSATPAPRRDELSKLTVLPESLPLLASALAQPKTAAAILRQPCSGRPPPAAHVQVRLFAVSLVCGRSIRRTLNGRFSMVRRFQYDPFPTFTDLDCMPHRRPSPRHGSANSLQIARAGIGRRINVVDLMHRYIRPSRRRR